MNEKRPIKENLHNIIVIIVLLILFFLPILMYSELPSTINLILIFLVGFFNSGVYIGLIHIIINTGLVFAAIYFLLNENKKRKFIYLFFGYFIYLFFLTSTLCYESLEIQMSLGNNMNDIVYTVTISSVILLFLLVYLIRREFCLGEINIGTFILFLVGSVILFDILIGFSPLIKIVEVLLNNESVEYEEALVLFKLYYFSFLGGVFLSKIDLIFLNYHK
jgi:hypothetical protein